MSKRSRKKAPATEVAIAPASSPPGVAAESGTPPWLLPVLAFLVLAFALLWRVPPGKAPDENEHLIYVQYMLARHQLPVFEATGGNAPGYEFHQPPLYYLLCAGPVAFTADILTQILLCRVVSIMCGALTVFFVWWGVRRLQPEYETLARAAAWLGALWPLHLGVSASGTNDALAGLFAAVLLALVAGWPRAWRPVSSLGAGVLLGLCLLTKNTAVLLLPVGLLAAVQAPRLHRADKAATARSLLLLLVGVLVIAGPWLARNQLLYGDPLAMGVFNQRFADNASATRNFLHGGVPLLTYIRAVAQVLYSTFWGVFGGPNHAVYLLNPFSSRGPRPDAMAGILMLALGAVLNVVGVLGWLRRPLRESAQRPVLVWWGLAFLMVAAGWLAFNFRFYQAQARYFHAALLPMILLLAWGLQHFPAPVREECPRRLSPAILTTLALFVLITLWNLVQWRTLA